MRGGLQPGGDASSRLSASNLVWAKEGGTEGEVKTGVDNSHQPGLRSKCV